MKSLIQVNNLTVDPAEIVGLFIDEDGREPIHYIIVRDKFFKLASFEYKTFLDYLEPIILDPPLHQEDLDEEAG